MRAVIYTVAAVVVIWIIAGILLLLEYAVPSLGINLGVQRVVSVSVVLSTLLFLGSVVALLLRIGQTSTRLVLVAAFLIVVLILLLFPGFLLLLEVLVPGLGKGLGTQTIALIAAVISALLALFGVLVSQVVNAYTTWAQRKSEREATQQDALQTYLNDALSPEQVNNHQPPDAQQRDEHTREATSNHDDSPRLSAKTQSLLLRLDGNRKRVLLQFLHGASLIARDKQNTGEVQQTSEAENTAPLNTETQDETNQAAMIRSEPPRSSNMDTQSEGAQEEGIRGEDSAANRTHPIINLSGASLAGAHLESIDLSGDSLKGANLKGGADLRRACLDDADFSAADLKGADLRDAHLSGADLRRADLQALDPTGMSITKLVKIYLRSMESDSDPGSADLRNADLSSADLTGAFLAGANLTGAKGVTKEELEEQAASLENAIMPNGRKYTKRLGRPRLNPDLRERAARRQRE